MAEQRLEGGYADGAGRGYGPPPGLSVDTSHARAARLPGGPGFTGAPRPLGFDEQGREVLTFLKGETIGHHKPRPAWVYAEGGTWSPGLTIAHNDATTHNAAWYLGNADGIRDKAADVRRRRATSSDDQTR